MNLTFLLILVTASFAALPRVRREVTDEEDTTTTMPDYVDDLPDPDDSTTTAASPRARPNLNVRGSVQLTGPLVGKPWAEPLFGNPLAPAQPVQPLAVAPVPFLLVSFLLGGLALLG
ncbi:hypothetical protein V3C99_009389 [Haemonchus contortus]|uniref:Secreted protein n=1 Tax=Haemonchus contortus TaxID=6289 RepID=A0A7I4YJP1_HAECO|nr:unnamed protein product [Haemonchus contortus]